MKRTEGVSHGGRHDGVDAGEGPVEEDHDGGVASLGGDTALAHQGEDGQEGGAESHGRPDDEETLLEPDLVVGKAPDDTAQSVGDVLEDSDAGEEVVVVDESETEGLAEVGHEAVAQSDGKEAGPDLKLK